MMTKRLDDSEFVFQSENEKSHVIIKCLTKHTIHWKLFITYAVRWQKSWCLSYCQPEMKGNWSSNIFRVLRRQIVTWYKCYTMNSSLLNFFFLFSILDTGNSFGFRTLRNYAFTGLVSERIYDVDWLGCIEACSRSENCESYNYKWWLSAEDDGHVCELIDDSGVYGECDTSSLTYATGFTFQKIKESIEVRVP